MHPMDTPSSTETSPSATTTAATARPVSPWTLGGTEYAGNLQARSDGAKAHLELTMTAPAAASLQVDLTQSGAYPWTATLDAPRFDPKPLLGDSSLQRTGAGTEGSGDQHGGSIDGRVDLNDYQLLLRPLRAQFSDDFNTLQLEQLSLASPQVKGQVDASGVVHLGSSARQRRSGSSLAGPGAARDLAGQVLNSQGDTARQRQCRDITRPRAISTSGRRANWPNWRSTWMATRSRSRCMRWI